MAEQQEIKVAEGQEFLISLDSPLEIESETTVVPVSQPTFLIKPAAKYNNSLTNSVKYEGDGYFIDWKHIKFQHGAISGTVTPNDFQLVSVSKTENTTTYLFSNGIQFTFYHKTPPLFLNCTLSYYNAYNIFINITFLGTTYTLSYTRDGSYNPGLLPNSVINNVGDGVVTSRIGDGVSTTQLTYRMVSYSDNPLDKTDGAHPTNGDTYSFDGLAVHTWNNFIRYNSVSNTLSFVTPSATLTGLTGTMSADGVLSGKYDRNDGINDAQFYITYNDQICDCAFATITASSPLSAKWGVRSGLFNPQYPDIPIEPEPYVNNVEIRYTGNCVCSPDPTYTDPSEITGIIHITNNLKVQLSTEIVRDSSGTEHLYEVAEYTIKIALDWLDSGWEWFLFKENSALTMYFLDDSSIPQRTDTFKWSIRREIIQDPSTGAQTFGPVEGDMRTDFKLYIDNAKGDVFNYTYKVIWLPITEENFGLLHGVLKSKNATNQFAPIDRGTPSTHRPLWDKIPKVAVDLGEIDETIDDELFFKFHHYNFVYSAGGFTFYADKIRCTDVFTPEFEVDNLRIVYDNPIFPYVKENAIIWEWYQEAAVQDKDVYPSHAKGTFTIELLEGDSWYYTPKKGITEYTGEIGFVLYVGTVINSVTYLGSQPYLLGEIYSTGAWRNLIVNDKLNRLTNQGWYVFDYVDDNTAPGASVVITRFKAHKSNMPTYNANTSTATKPFFWVWTTGTLNTPVPPKLLWALASYNDAAKAQTLNMNFGLAITYNFVAKTFFISNNTTVFDTISSVSGLNSGSSVILSSTSTSETIPIVFTENSITTSSTAYDLVYQDPQIAKFIKDESFEWQFSLPSAFNRTDPSIELVSFTDTTVVFTYRGRQYSVVVGAVANNNYKWVSEDIRSRTERVLLDTPAINEYVIENNFWCDDDQKEVWVVDRNTLIVVHWTDEISLWKKEDWTPTNMDDRVLTQYWKWNKVQSIRRTSWFNATDRYGCSCAVNDLPFVWKLNYTSDKLLLSYAKTSASTLNLTWYNIQIPTYQAKASANDLIKNNAIAQYPPYETIEEIWNISKLTATNKGGQFWFGIAFDNGFKQWVIKCSTSSISGISYGYGFVGIDGTLTGGCFPEYAVDTNGLKAIKLEDSLPEFYDKATGSYLLGSAYYFSAFNNLVIAIEGGNVLIKVPFLQKYELYQVRDSKVEDDGRAEMTTPLPPISMIIGYRGDATSEAWNYIEGVATSWRINEKSKDTSWFKKVSSKPNVYDVLSWRTGAGAKHAPMMLGFGMSGGASSAIPSTPGSVEDISALMQELQKNTESASTTSAGKADTLDHTYQISIDMFYTVSGSNYIRAGAGFTQLQLCKQVSHMGSGIYVKKSADGFAGSEMAPPKGTYIPAVFGGFVVGFTMWGPFGDPNLAFSSTGILTMIEGRSMPYREYGYSHRYIDFPTYNVNNFESKDIDVYIEKVSSVAGAPFKSPKGYSKYKPQSWSGRMAVVEGSIMPDNVVTNGKRSFGGSVDPQFSGAYVYDYCVYKPNELFYTAIDGEIVAVSVRDTKVLDGIPSNVVISNSITLIGSPYVALEILPPSMYDFKYLRPRAVTPQTLLMNQTGVNCIHGDKIFHACDAYSNRHIRNVGITGFDCEELVSFGSYRADDDFKVSSIYPKAPFFGKFTEPFGIAYKWHVEQKFAEYSSLNAASENDMGFRYSVPVIYKRLAILPAVEKTLAAYKLNVVEGVTSLVTDLRTTLPEARRPDSLDFAVYGEIYRWNPEYISAVKNAMGVQTITDLVATLGLTYIGSTMDAAWFYSRAIRSFYTFQPNSVKRTFNADRYINVTTGEYDFVSQEVILNPLTPRGKELVRTSGDKIIGNIVPPPAGMGPFEFYSMAGGVTLQGLWHFQVNRFLIMDEMLPNIKSNFGSWTRVKGNDIRDFWKPRDYGWTLDPQRFTTDARVRGWFTEIFPLATAYLGVDDKTEAMFEWDINFQMSDTLLELWGTKFISVYIAAETMTVGGVVESNVKHLRLHKHLFTTTGRGVKHKADGTGQRGYYSFRYFANNGIGDSERLYLWTDAPITIRAIRGITKSITTNRHTVKEIYDDVKELEEL